MAFQNKVVRSVLFTVLLIGMYGTVPVQAGVEEQDEQECNPGQSWMWVGGDDEPDVARQVEQELAEHDIHANVESTGYGEMDNCGSYEQRGLDFTIHLEEASYPGLAEDLLPILTEHSRPLLGNVKLFSPDGQNISTQFESERSALEATQVGASGVGALSGDPITRKVYVIVFDPLLSNGKTLSKHLGWNDAATLTQQTVDFFKQATSNKMNYEVVETTVVTSGWPRLADGFTYTESSYLAVWANPSLHHEPTGVDYNHIVNSPEFDVCGKANRSEIDEVWLYGGPWFGYWESTLVGPGAYIYNSWPVPGPHNCNRLIPIMGPSLERGVTEAVHNFGHRSEATMQKVYGGWQQNSTSHNWNKFGLVKFQSPSYSYSGCGSIHYPPNATSAYSYSDPSSALSNCHDFLNYPSLSDPLQVVQPVTCSAWGCTHLGFLSYWFAHIPSAPGCGPDNVANDWWKYLAFPANALYPSLQSLGCQPEKHWISGNAGGLDNVTVHYFDGSPRSVYSDAYGFYSMLVPKHWSGTITPTRPDHVFTPASISYSDVQSDLFEQNYTASYAGLVDKPGIPILVSPTNRTLVSTLRPVLNWQDTKPVAYHYGVQVGPNSDFSGWVIYETSVFAPTFTPASDLFPGRLYYWRVKVYNVNGLVSGWSTVGSFKTPLEQPMLVSPVEGESLLTDRPTFDWSRSDSTSQYILQVSRASTFSTLLFNQIVTGSDYRMTKDLPQNETLYWRVSARTSDVTSPWSEVRSFKTGNPPSVPGLVSPATNVLVKDYTPLFNWKNCTLPANTTFQHYEIQVDDHTDFFSPEIQGTTTSGDITDSDFTPLTNLAPNTKFYWRVRAVSMDNHVSGWSPFWSLRTLIAAPQSLRIIPNGSKPLQPGFDWGDTMGTIKNYSIQISTSASFSTLLVNSTTNVSAYTMTKNLPAHRTIYWRVRVNGNNGPSPWYISQFITP